MSQFADRGFEFGKFARHLYDDFRLFAVYGGGFYGGVPFVGGE